MPFDFKKLEIPEVRIVKPKVFQDDRGFFLEVYKHSDFKAAGINKPFVQVNHSKSQKGVVRGLHFQKQPKAQAKLVTVISGSVWDVAVDLRKESTTFGKWVAEELSTENKFYLYIPEGFAHGFCVLSDYAQIIYYCTEEYSPDHESGIRWNDPDLQIDWPVNDAVLSPRDLHNPLLKDIDTTF